MALANIAKVDAVAAAAIAKINGLVFTAAAPGAFLLDTYTGAAAGYSTRRLATSATNLMRIREDAGDTETDIGYDSNNELDTAAIATHCGTANGYVVTWYDQANSNDADQTTEASQPQIYDGTTQAVLEENGKPIIKRISANSTLTTSLTGNSTLYIFAAAKVYGTDASILISDSGTDFTYTLSARNFSFLTIVSNNFGSVTYYHNSSGTTYANQQEVLQDAQSQSLFSIVADSSSVTTGYEFGNTGTQSGTGAIYGQYSMQEVILYHSDQSSNRTGIETNINSEYLIYQPTDAPTSGLLADYTGAAAAYSVRQLSDKAVMSMRVRRDSDDEEINIGFDANGDLDTTAISDFCSTANGYVTRWWDQSTNGNHADQATDTSQPQIYNGTAVITQNGKPALEFDGIDDQINGLHLGTGTTLHQFNLLSSTETTGTFPYLTYTSASFRLKLGHGTNEYSAQSQTSGGVIASTNTIDVGTQLLHSALTTPTTFDTYANGVGTSQSATLTVNLLSSTSFGRSGNAYLSCTAQEFVFWNADQSSNRSGIEENINSEYLIYQPTDAPTSGLLATYTGAAAAYSVRQLSDKAILSMRVRRDSDDVEQNFGFDSNGDLDTAGIASFCGTANGYVTRWWDQSTNGNHADQATDTSQPQIYNGTAVITENGKPALSKNSGGSGVLNTSAISGLTTISMFDVATLGDTGNRVTQLGNVIHAGAFMYQGSLLNFTSTNTAQALTSLFFKATDEAYINGSQVASGNAGTASAGSGVIGGQSATLRVIDSMQEFIFYDFDQTSPTNNRTGIETDINDYFSIY